MRPPRRGQDHGLPPLRYRFGADPPQTQYRVLNVPSRYRARKPPYLQTSRLYLALLYLYYISKILSTLTTIRALQASKQATPFKIAGSVVTPSTSLLKVISALTLHNIDHLHLHALHRLNLLRIAILDRANPFPLPSPPRFPRQQSTSRHRFGAAQDYKVPLRLYLLHLSGRTCT